MATAVDLEDVLLVKAFCSMNDQVGINGTHWVVKAIAGTPFYEELVSPLSVTMASIYTGYLPDSGFYWGSTLKRVGGGAVTATFLPSAGAAAGTVAQPPLPLQVSAIVTLRTALAGRSYRGRIYPPFLPASYADVQGRSNGQVVVDLAGLAAFYSTDHVVIGATGQMTIRPYIYSQGLLERGRVIGATVRDRFATQRRRGQTGRPNTIPPF